MVGPMVSIITVSYNAAGCIGQTIESVHAQNYWDYEYIFVDGKSQDGTMEIIEACRETLTNEGISCTVISEKDSGIYDAMNKGLSLVRGQWVLMLNAGDCLADAHVLSSIFSGSRPDGDILYGDVILREKDLYKYSPALPAQTLLRDMPFCHQSVFVRRNVAVACRFDTRYRLAADYDQLLRCYLDRKKFVYLPQPVSIYDVSGVSEKNFLATLKEQKAARSRLGLPKAKPIWYAYLLRMRARIIQKLFPTVSRSKARGWYASPEDAQKAITERMGHCHAQQDQTNDTIQ